MPNDLQTKVNVSQSVTSLTESTSGAEVNKHDEDMPRCPVSGSYDIRLRRTVKDHACSGEQFQIWENRDTGLLFTWPRPDPNAIVRYYAMNEYLSHDSSGKGLFATAYRTARTFALRWKLSLIKKQTAVASVRLLDFGAGTGEFAAYCKEQHPGWQIRAIETDKKAAGLIKENYGIATSKSLDDFPKSEKFSIITAWHALEHVHHPDEILRKFHNRLFDHGLLVIALPNDSSYDAVFYGDEWAGYDVPRHLTHFSPDAFRRLAEDNGFEVIAAKRMLLDAFYVSLLSESYNSDKRLFSSFRALFVAIWSNFLSLLNVNRCSSVTYILRKTG